MLSTISILRLIIGSVYFCKSISVWQICWKLNVTFRYFLSMLESESTYQYVQRYHISISFLELMILLPSNRMTKQKAFPACDGRRNSAICFFNGLIVVYLNWYCILAIDFDCFYINVNKIDFRRNSTVTFEWARLFCTDQYYFS